jgi:antitoxin ParD1/3/4
MPSRNVNLTEHFDRFIEGAVSTGRYQNASEVVREGLRLLERQQHEDEHKLELLRAAVREGEEAYARGDYVQVGEEQLEAFVAGLGREAGERVRARGA